MVNNGLAGHRGRRALEQAVDLRQAARSCLRTSSLPLASIIHERRDALRSPDGAKRTPGRKNTLLLPDSAATQLHPGYAPRE